MRSFRTLDYAATGLLTGLATAIFVVVACNKVTGSPREEASGLALAGLLLLIVLPVAGAVLGVVIARRTRQGRRPDLRLRAGEGAVG